MHECFPQVLLENEASKNETGGVHKIRRVNMERIGRYVQLGPIVPPGSPLPAVVDELMKCLTNPTQHWLIINYLQECY